MKKRMLSLFLAVVLVVGMLPVAAFAANDPATVTADGAAVPLTYLGEYTEKQYGYDMIPVYHLQVSADATVSITCNRGGYEITIPGDFSTDILYYPHVLTRDSMQKYFIDASGYITTENEVAYVEILDNYWSPMYALLIELVPGETHVHEWQDATCTTAKICTSCGATEGGANGHSWLEATCTAPKTCSVCNATEGEALGHDYVDGICSRCSDLEDIVSTGPATVTADGTAVSLEYLGEFTEKQYGSDPIPVYHLQVSADATVSITCNSGGYEITIPGDWSTDTLNYPHILTRDSMQKYFIDASGYITTENEVAYIEILDDWWAPMYALLIELVPAGTHVHEWQDATCTTAKICTSCGATEGGANGHSWLEASCTAPKTCSVCTETEGEALGHNYVDGTCTRCYGLEDSGDSTAPVTVTVNGLSLAVTSLGDQSYPDSWGDPVTAPFFTVKIPEGAAFVIDGSGVGNVTDFHRRDGISISGTHPFTMTAAYLENYIMTAEAFEENFTFNHGLNTENQVAFIEARNSGDRVYCLLVEIAETEAEHTHDWAGEWTQDEENHWYVCSGCEETKDLSAHTYGEWITDTDAACGSDGTKHRECTVCGYVESGTIPTTGAHDYTDDYEDNGDGTTHTAYCACGAEQTEDHSFSINGEITIAPTKDREGKQEVLCVCGAKSEKTLSRLPATDDITVSIEVHNGDGGGRFLQNPKRLSKQAYVNDYVIDTLVQAMGSTSFVKYSTQWDDVGGLYSITGIYDPTQADSYLNNGDLEGFQWLVLVNNGAWSGRDWNSNYKLQSGDVVRCIFTSGTAASVSGTDKDALVQLVGTLSGDIWYESDSRYPAYKTALETITDQNATQVQVDAALAALQNALIVDAQSVEITAGESMELGLNKSTTLQATVSPADTTDTLVWRTSDSSIVTVDPASGKVTGVTKGTATVTAMAGAASDSIQITVTEVAAQSITITTGDVSVEARFSVQLEADITPEYSTDVVVWSVADESTATVDADGKLTGIQAGTTTVTATAGAVSDTIEVTVLETTSPYVYFRYSDGRVQEMKDDTFTLTALDEGSFLVGNLDSTLNWHCSEYVSDGYGGYEYRYWISGDGKYQPHGAKQMTASVSGTDYSKIFYINTVTSGISQIKAYIGGEEVNGESPYEVTGMVSGIPITVQGLNGDGEWVHIPVQAVTYKSSDTNVARINGNQMDLIAEGTSQISVSMVDNSAASVSFDAVCSTVMVTRIDVKVPTVPFVMDKWDSMSNAYIGITMGYEDPDTEYHVVYTPSNATNQNLIWEDLTPEIAEFQELHSAGIVPKKAGTARFRVTSEANPQVSQEVSVTFAYKEPLQSAAIEQTSYSMNVGDSITPNITFTPSNATETRFNWTYSQNGIVKVTESIISDTYNRYISRKIIALADGTVTVTGTPIDDTAGCKPVVFTVTVGGSGETETVDYLKIAREDIAHGLRYLSSQTYPSYGNEWTIFTNLRAGGFMDMQMQIIYLQSVEAELSEYAEELVPTDYARLVLTLPLLGVSPENFDGLDLVAALYNNQALENQPSNQISWTLLALDSRDYDIPDDALWTREKLIAKILTFQASDGSFGLSGGGSGSVDMTGMILQALAPYYRSGYPGVQGAVDRALEYLKGQMNENVGYIAEGGENGCTAAQVLTALAALGIDPTDPANGFTLGTKNLITNLDSFKQESGFAYLTGQGTNAMGTQQITYAMEAYRRYAEGQNGLYDLTDIRLAGEEKETYTVTLPTGAGFAVEAANGSTSPVEEGSSYSFTVTVSDGYRKSDSFAVKANGTELTENGGVYTIDNITADQTVTVDGVVQEVVDTTVPVSILSGGENCTVTGIGDRTYTGAFNSQYTLPFYTVRVREDAPFVIAKTQDGDGANGSSRGFANIKGESYSASYPYTMSVGSIDLYVLSAEQFLANFGRDTGLNTENKVAFIEVKYDTERLFGLLVELVPAPVTYTVTLPTGTGYVAAAKDSASPVEQGGSYSFTVSINESFEKSDSFTVKANGVALTEQNGSYTISNITEDQVITVEGVVAKPTTGTLTVTAAGENCAVSNTGLTSYKQGAYGTVSGVPVYRVSVPEDTDFVVNWNFGSDGGNYEGRYAFSIDASGDMGIKYYPFTMSTDSMEDYLLDAETVVECFGEGTGLDLDNRIAFLEVYNSNLTEGDGNPLYGLLVEFTPEVYTVSLPSGTGYTAEAVDGSTSPVKAYGSFRFVVTVDEGYEKSNDFAVKANGTALTEVGGKYTVQNISENITITVTGVTKKAEKITVRFTLLGCHKHSEGETAVHTLLDGNLQTWISAKRYEVGKDATVKDLLELALSENGMSCGNPTGNYVKYITRNGVRLGEFTNGSLSGWMYTINGAHSGLGVAEQKLKEGDVVIFHYTDDYTKENGSSGYVDEEEKAANAVEDLIDAIGTVSLNSAAKITAARKAYNALSYAQKQLVDNYTTLTAAEARYARLKQTDNEKKAAAVENLIDAIQAGSTTFGNNVKAAQAAYNNLTAEQKQLVDNYYKLVNYQKELADEKDKDAAEAVEKLIGELDTITLDSEDAIKAAREAYDKLTDGQKVLIENLAILEAAEDRLEQLKADAVIGDIYQTTGDYLEDLGTPVPGSVGGEWMVIGLARSGREVPGADDYFASVVAYVRENIDGEERLHSAKSTDNSRLILALTALGKDVTDVDGHNLLNGLNDMTFVRKQGINGPIWALIAFDSGNYPTPEGDVTREALIQVILDAQLADGGWALSGETSDADITGMAVQALAPYYESNADVQKALNEAVETMSKMQNAEGSYGSIDGTSSESVAQIIAALAALGIDAHKDGRFIKNGISAVDALCAFYVEGGGFKHLLGGNRDGMATEQGYYALTAYFRMLDGNTALYDMTDVIDMGGDVVEDPVGTESVETIPVGTEPAETEDEGGFPWWIILVIAAAGVVIAIAVPVIRKKFGAK